MNLRVAATLAVAFAAISIAIFAARPLATPGPLLRDFEAYWSAGATSNAGGDAYGRDIWNAERTIDGIDASRDEILPFVGPPPALLIWKAFALLPYERAARVWTAVLALAALALIVTTLRGTRVPLSWPAALAALALAVGFGPLTSDLALGQIALLAFAGAALPASGTGTFLAALQPNVALAVLVRVGRNVATVAMALGALAAFAAGAIAAGWAWPLAYARLTVAHQTAERFSAIQMTPGAVAYGFGASEAVAIALGIAVAAAAIAAAIALCVRVRDTFARFAACSALLPFVAAFFHEHDLIVAFPAAVWCAVHVRGRARAIALVATLLVSVDWLGLAQRPSGIAQGTLLALAAIAAFIVLGEDGPRLPELAAVAVVVAIFAGAATLGAHHPSPVWPDTLGAYRAGPGASIAQVWNEEQRRAGLLAAAPVWSVLRALSLAGCALLAACVARCPRRSCCRTASTLRDGSSSDEDCACTRS